MYFKYVFVCFITHSISFLHILAIDLQQITLDCGVDARIWEKLTSSSRAWAMASPPSAGVLKKWSFYKVRKSATCPPSSLGGILLKTYLALVAPPVARLPFGIAFEFTSAGRHC
jgi:hypothetical protein